MDQLRKRLADGEMKNARTVHDVRFVKLFNVFNVIIFRSCIRRLANWSLLLNPRYV